MTRHALLALLLAPLLAFALPARAASFATPSGNILCYAPGSLGPSEAGLVCLIFEANWSPPLHEPCDLDRTAAIVLEPSGTPFGITACQGDVFWPYPTPQLSYGSEWVLEGFRCEVATTGVRCTNAQGHGFEMARRGRRLF
ncbi:DUF6636 domain-containing protein [Vannielia litorea]|uniref:DUF6636 domain-containing protein n=1 Tax=Vannielia litorea TaxID=1217970 RepID=UPI001BD0848D|nr:DUF6636 domain-containing protein [Vannielia litorea]MBS8225796.1 hypothetical protein [Vannielia litorea]